MSTQNQRQRAGHLHPIFLPLGLIPHQCYVQRPMRLFLAQLNQTIVDFSGNLARIAAACQRARHAGATLVLTPELAVTGYPPLDLLERPDVLHAGTLAIERLAEMSHGLILIAGVALPNDGPGRPAVNAAVVLQDGRFVAAIRKRLLPSYDVFDEDRYFQPGTESRVLELAGRKIGITICEDIWHYDELGQPRYPLDTVKELVDKGADCVLNLSASPFEVGKPRRRMDLVRGIAAQHGIPLAYCNLVGGNDSLIFDGRSFAVDGHGRVLATAEAFVEADLVVTLPEKVKKTDRVLGEIPPAFQGDPPQEVRQALVVGIRDYVRKCGLKTAVLGLSGGIDSALTAALAVEALGAENVTGVAMPGPYNSEGSVTDALKLAENLGIRCPIIPIAAPYQGFHQALQEEFARFPQVTADVTDQNLQARARGVILMALSNKTGSILLSTGNKSELAVGYCTLYGDMNGGLAVIGDVPKTLVYEVARTYNQQREIIPIETIVKPPSAELAPGQKDEDSLPPYPVLDAILQRHVEDRWAIADIVTQGYSQETVERVIRLVELNEYKRRQAAPVLRVTRKAFGGGRRVPMARNLNFPPKELE